MVISCTEKDMSLEIFTVPTIKGIECKLYYQDGVLQEVRQTRRSSKNYALSTYWFFENGNISSIEKVIGDSILSTVSYFKNGNIEYVKSDFDLNPNDTILLLHGEYKKFYENGTLRSIGRYERGEKRDTFKYFDEQGDLIQFEVFDEYLR